MSRARGTLREGDWRAGDATCWGNDISSSAFQAARGPPSCPQGSWNSASIASHLSADFVVLWLQRGYPVKGGSQWKRVDGWVGEIGLGFTVVLKLHHIVQVKVNKMIFRSDYFSFKEHQVNRRGRSNQCVQSSLVSVQFKFLMTATEGLG